MIVVIGGAWQGKRAFAQTILALPKEEFDRSCAIGGQDPVDQAFQKPYVTDAQEWLRKMAQTLSAEAEDGGPGGEIWDQAMSQANAFAWRLAAAKPEIITYAEVGCGIVPLKYQERLFREMAGKAGQILASEADEVYRVCCGLPVLVKGAGTAGAARMKP